MSLTRILLPCACIGIALGVAGCGQLQYYSQAARGQWQVVSQRQDIDALLAAADTPPPLRARLERVREIRRFAVRRLDLPDNDSYRSYTDLGRPYVAWNVVAAPAYSIQPKTWCFPVAGCVAYKGFFSEQDAAQEEQRLIDQGYDTFRYGVSAYSTLGWFADPVLNTFIHYDETALAGLIFHELAHQVAYADGDTAFNEAFATAVERAGVELWLRTHAPDALADYLADRERRERVTEMVLGFRNRLARAYGDGAQSGLEQTKQAIFREMKNTYRDMALAGGGSPYYDWWFSLDLNNAHLVSLSTYHRLAPAFSRALERAESFAAFYEQVKELSRADAPARERWLAGLRDDTE